MTRTRPSWTRTPKDKDKDKDLTPKDQDKDKDLKKVLKESLRTRTRTRINIPGYWPTFMFSLRTSDNIWGSLYAISPYLFHTSSQFIHSNLETLFFSKSYNSFIPDIYTASLHETYSKALSVQLPALPL